MRASAAGTASSAATSDEARVIPNRVLGDKPKEYFIDCPPMEKVLILFFRSPGE
jgi:hypothetical protein